MAEQVRAAVRTGPGRTEIREFPMPDIPDDGALLKVEVAGICGTDVKMYAEPPYPDPVIMGHENVGVIARAGRAFRRRQGLGEGDRVFVEHYVGCFNCEWCRIGEYRHCEATDWRTNPDARRYGYTTSDNPYHLWGGFAQYMYLPWNSILHKVPDGVTAELAGVATPLSNGIEWALLAAGVGYDSSVLIQGPGQQGLSQAVACKQAEDALDRIREITGGKGVDFVLDCTAGAGVAPVLLGIDALKRREGVLLIQGEMAAFPDFPVKKLTEKAITIKSARGHSFRACELAVRQLASGRFPLAQLATHRFGLDQVDRAIRAVGGEAGQDVVHVSLMPWEE